MSSYETIAVAAMYAMFALVGPFMISMLLRWSASIEAENLMLELGSAVEVACKLWQ